MECDYYLNILSKSRMDGGCDDVCAVPLKDLLWFPKVRVLCGEDGVQDIR